jgi:CDP-diacylglycerol--glycerol-3-phosphate 3-phosphatidyltransferase
MGLSLFQQPARVIGGPMSIRDLANAAGALTTARIVAAVCFPLVVHDRGLALAVLAIGILTDIADGPVARRQGTVSHTGAVYDGWADKILHINCAWAMVLAGIVPGTWMLLWFLREIILWPLFLAVLGRYLRGDTPMAASSRAGRWTTHLIVSAMVAALLNLHTVALACTVLGGLLGAVTGCAYLWDHITTRDHGA